jgi:hypothetical protein
MDEWRNSGLFNKGCGTGRQDFAGRAAIFCRFMCAWEIEA